LADRPQPLTAASGVARFAVRRLGQSVVTLLLASVVVWQFDAASSIDPAQEVLASRGVPSASSAQINAVRHELGLDRSEVHQYLHWLTGAIRGNFGRSWINGEPVRSELATRIGPTLLLAGVAVLIVSVAAVVFGCVSALLAWRWPDLTIRALTVLVAALPPFVLGIFLIHFVVIRFGIGAVITDGSLHDVLLPAICVAAGSVAVPTRILRSSMVSALREDYAQMARARGGRPIHVVITHALPNSLVPFVNAIALSAPWMIGGTFVVEAVFSWPGVGALLVQSVEQRDIPVVQAIVLLTTAAYLVAGFLADTLTRIVDPRIEYGER
jgi:ABC-type dipeptide/oligopeptide/nickel transport system permease component